MRLKLSLVLSTALLVLIIFSCKKKKKNVDPFGGNNPACALLSVIDQHGNSLRNYEYVADNLIRIYSLENPETVMSFRYNSNNQVELMEVETSESTEKMTVNYTFDEAGRISETTTSVAGIPFMTNVFIISNGKITGVQTSVKLFGKEITGITRIEYFNDNVNKVYSSIDGEPEKLAFVGEVYDNKSQFHPAAYRVAALGFVGIANNFFSFFGKNNLLAGRIYDENGQPDQKTEIIYQYSKNGMPSASEITTITDGDITTQKVTYAFSCN